MKSFKTRFNRPAQEKRFRKFIEGVKRQDRWKDDAAELAIKNIQIETRKQKFIKDGSSQPAIGEPWKERKRELAKYNTKGKSYSPNKSNLTFTGQLLESLQRAKHKTKVIIEPTGTREPYRDKNGVIKSKKLTNKKLAGYLKEQGRYFLGYNDKLKKAVKKKLLEHIRRNLKDFNNR